MLRRSSVFILIMITSKSRKVQSWLDPTFNIPTCAGLGQRTLASLKSPRSTGNIFVLVAFRTIIQDCQPSYQSLYSYHNTRAIALAPVPDTIAIDTSYNINAQYCPIDSMHYVRSATGCPELSSDSSRKRKRLGCLCARGQGDLYQKNGSVRRWIAA